MSSALAAKGTLLKVGDGAGSETFTTIAEVLSIGGPSISQEALDVTNHSSTSGWKEYVGGLNDGGEVTFEVNYLPTNATHNATAGVLNDLENRTLRNFQLVFPGSTTWSFAALVTKFEPSAPVDGVLRASISLKLSGVPTLA